MIQIPAVRFLQSEVTLYVGYMRASDLCENGVIDTWDSAKGWDIQDQGYQRESDKKHFKAIAKFLTGSESVLLPTSLLISARTAEQGQLAFAVISESGDHAFGYLEVPDAHPLYIVDGQHRMLGFKHAREELGQDSLGDFRLPVVILCDADKVGELTQFHLVNSRQKKIATNLAFALLGTVVEDRPSIAQMLVGPRGAWKMRALTIAVALNEAKDPQNVWEGRISLPNEPKTPTAAATLASFVNSLKPFFSRAYPHSLGNAELEGYLNKFWSALNAIMPKPFKSPRDYVIQRTTGVYSLNRVAAELARQETQVLRVSPQEIQRFLTADKVNMTEEVWINGGRLAQDYRGHARFRDLADEILKAMGLEPSRPGRP